MHSDTLHVMSVDQSMWTHLESALAPFKELARLNRQTVTGADGESVQLVLSADRCHVDAERIELGFSLGAEPYSVGLARTDYRRDGGWDFDRIRADISAGLRSGAMKSGTPFELTNPSLATGRSARPEADAV